MESNLFRPAGEPPIKLGRYRTLSPTAGVRVSPLVLGGLSLGSKWSNELGRMKKESSIQLLDAFYNADGNSIDTVSS
jgi:aryl-alcohol dehydrogenase-like predicted oxidoreductase